MKSFVALSLFASLAVAPVVVSAAESKPAAPATKSAAKPAAAPAAAPAAPEVKTLAEPVVGYLFTRKGGGYINLLVEGNNFALSFYNSKKEEEKPNIEKAIVRFRRFGRDQRFLLTPASDGMRLTSSLHVERPYRFTITLLTFKAGQEEADESFVQLFHQPMKGDGEGVPADEMAPEQLQKVQK